jgi:hypothetical protein
MKINLTKKEYRLLLEVLYLSDWMMHSHLCEKQHIEHENLRKKLLSYYKEMGAEDIIEPANEFDDYMHHKFINLYDENTFWDELTDRLAMRDIIKKIGVEQYQALEGIERVTKVEEMRDRYVNEFEQHGLENIKLSCESSVKN